MQVPFFLGHPVYIQIYLIYVYIYNFSAICTECQKSHLKRMKAQSAWVRPTPEDTDSKHAEEEVTERLAKVSLKPLCVEIGTPSEDDTSVARNRKESPLWTPSCWMTSLNSSSTSENEQPNAVEVYNEAITRIASLTSDEPATLTCQLTSTWSDTPANKKNYILKQQEKLA